MPNWQSQWAQAEKLCLHLVKTAVCSYQSTNCPTSQCCQSGTLFNTHLVPLCSTRSSKHDKECTCTVLVFTKLQLLYYRAVAIMSQKTSRLLPYFRMANHFDYYYCIWKPFPSLNWKSASSMRVHKWSVSERFVMHVMWMYVTWMYVGMLACVGAPHDSNFCRKRDKMGLMWDVGQMSPKRDGWTRWVYQTVINFVTSPPNISGELDHVAHLYAEIAKENEEIPLALHSTAL